MKDFFEHIDDYMEGTLSIDERAAFEAEMNRNISLKNAVMNYHDGKKLSEGLLELDIAATLEKLQQEANANEQDRAAIQNKNGSNMRRWLLLLGLVGGVLALLWWFGNRDTMGLDKSQILASYERPIDEEVTRSVDTIGMNHFQKGKHFFILNRFQESEEWLKRYIEIEKDQKLLSQAYFWLGSAHLEQWEVKEAKSVWSKSEETKAKTNLSILE